MIIRVANVNGQQEFRVYEHGQIIARFDALSRAEHYIHAVQAAELFTTIFKIYQTDLCHSNPKLHHTCKKKFHDLGR